MVLGIGRLRKQGLDAVSSDDDKGFNGFPSVIVLEDMVEVGSGGTRTTDAGEFVTLAYYDVQGQEEVMWGAKDSDSEEIEKLDTKVRNDADEALPDETKARLTYSTRAGRSRDVIFEQSIARLEQEDFDNLRKLAPKPWGSGGATPPSGRGSPARAKQGDRLNFEIRTSEPVEVSYANSSAQFPVTFKQD